MRPDIGIILAVGMIIVAVGLFSWQHNGDVQASVEPVEPVEQPLIPEWKPRVKEFTLDDGTRCVSISTRATTFPQDSGFSGISCNWKTSKN